MFNLGPDRIHCSITDCWRRYDCRIGGTGGIGGVGGIGGISNISKRGRICCGRICCMNIKSQWNHLKPLQSFLSRTHSTAPKCRRIWKGIVHKLVRKNTCKIFCLQVYILAFGQKGIVAHIERICSCNTKDSTNTSKPSICCPPMLFKGKLALSYLWLFPSIAPATPKYWLETRGRGISCVL